MTIISRLTTILLATLAFGGGAQAGTLPDDYPQGFAMMGRIDRVDAADRELLVYDSFYALAPVMPVHASDSGLMPVSSLRKGMMVGGSYRRNARGQKVVTEIWVLPDGYVDESEE